jgi:hypothetical protein
MIRSCVVGMALVALAVPSRLCAESMPPDAREMLIKAENFDLYSLEPRAAQGETDFHGWKVLGKTAVKEADVRKKLITALEKGAAESDGSRPDCFNPRHGIRVSRGGKTMDLVICFECQQVEVYAGDERGKNFLISKSPRPVFNQVLKDARVPLPKQE